MTFPTWISLNLKTQKQPTVSLMVWFIVGGHLEFVSLFPDQLKVTECWGEAAPAVIGPDNMCAACLTRCTVQLNAAWWRTWSSLDLQPTHSPPPSLHSSLSLCFDSQAASRCDDERLTRRCTAFNLHVSIPDTSTTHTRVYLVGSDAQKLSSNRPQADGSSYSPAAL